MVGIGIVGLGFGTAVHVPAWRLDKRAKVLAVCGRDAGKTQKKADELGLEALDFESMLGRSDIHVLSLAVPPHGQPALIEAAARAGKHLFCEKPLASNLADAQRAWEVVGQSSIRHGIDLLFPELPAWQAAHDCLPRLGPLKHLHLSWLLESRAFRDQLVSWKTSLFEGGGAIGNFASHSLHYLEWLGGKVQRVLAWSTADPAQQAHAQLLLQLDHQVQASLTMAADAFQGSGHRLEIYGRQGALRLLNNSGDFARGFHLEEATREVPEWHTVVAPVAPQRDEGDGRIEPVGRLVSRLLDCIQADRPMHPGLAEGLRIQGLLEAAGRSLREERWVEVSHV